MAALESMEAAPDYGPNMVPLKHMAKLLETIMAFDKLAKDRPVESIQP